MKSHHFFNLLFFICISLTLSFSTNGENYFKSIRRILHQPLFPDSSSPPPDDTSSFPPPPPPDGSGFDLDQPFFPEGGTTTTPYQTPPPPPTSSLGLSNGIGPSPKPTATPTKPTKKVALAVSVVMVTLGMLSALVFYLYKHTVKNPVETQKLVPSPNGGNIRDSGPNNSRAYAEESRAPPPPSNFLYIGTVEPSNQRSVLVNEDTTANGSPYQKLNSSNNIDNNVQMKRSDRYRPSPDLQPLPPLSRAPARAVPMPVPVPVPVPQRNSSPTATFSSSDDEKSDILFYTPHGSMHSSIGSGDDGYWTQAARSSSGRMNGGNDCYKGGEINGGSYFPYSRRTSPRSRGLASSPDVIKHAIIPSIKAATTSTTAPPPPPPPPPRQVVAEANDIKEYSNQAQEKTETWSNLPKRAKVAAPPPPPNLALLRSISSTSPSHPSSNPHPPPPPPPPPPPRGLISVPRKAYNKVENGIPEVSKVSPQKLQVESCNPRDGLRKESLKSDDYDEFDNGCSSSGRPNGDDLDERRPKLKPLHWDKVKATSDRATVWDQLKSSSFQLNEDMMESLFGCNSTTTVTKETTRKSVLPPVEKENRVLDPKKSQNIAILLRALNVTRDEVAEGLTDGNLEGLGAELFETLVKMAPTKEEEIKLKDYNGDLSKLGAAERFLKGILDIPFAFKRVEAMLYRANFDAEVKYLTKSFETLEVASEELKNSRLFLKLLEAVLQTGNRMNAGTNRGDVKAFKLDTLLKLVDIKGTDGKTTLLHFVVQEIIRSEGLDPDVNPQTLDQLSSIKKEEEFRKQGLQIVSGLSRELGSVKSAAGMDSDVLSSYVSKLELGLEKVKLVLQLEKPDIQGRFFESMKIFLKEATDQIARVKAHERKALAHVREVTQYFHGDTSKEEAHPFRIFLIVRDFLSILDNVCKEVRTMESRSIMGTARSFRISAYASLPVLTKYNVRRDDSSGDEGMSS